MTDASTLSATEMTALFGKRQLSPTEAWADVEKTIARWEPRLAALYAFDPERARDAARGSTERWARGEPKSALDGVPVSIKELIATQGTPVPLGTAATELIPAGEDAPAAARLREDGAVIFAKTTCPDYGMLSSGLSSFHPLSRNPWDLALTPGGSSAGAGAAAAAGYGPLHVGTDIGGSIRIPAGLTGTVGLKPSHGRVPVDPPYVGRVIGPMTRTVADAALLMATLSRPDGRDPTSLPFEPLDWRTLGVDLKGLRIGLMHEAGCGLPVDPEIAAAVADAARVFSGAGAIVEPVRPVLTRDMLDGIDRYWRARFWGQMLQLDEARRARILPYVREWAEGGASLSGVDAVRGFDQTFAMRHACGQLFRQVDAVISPTNPVSAWAADWASPVNDPARPFEHIGFTLPWNMGEQPAASVNCGWTGAGLPIGLQIVAPRFADRLVLGLALHIEAATERRTPTPPAE